MSTITSIVTGDRQDVVGILESDHRKVEQLFKDIKAASGRRRSSLVEQLGRELSLHMSIEEALVYPRVSRFDSQMGAEAKAEHALARKVLRELQRLTPDRAGFDGALGMVEAGIEHHVREEEGELFPKLRRELGDEQMDELTEAVRSAKERGRAPRRAAATTRKRSSSSTRTRASSSSRATSARARKRTTPSTSRRSTSRSAGAAPTKEQLVREAKRAGIAGYSRMNKRELARALSR
jgi:hemerythrin superfamily protein